MNFAQSFSWNLASLLGALSPSSLFNSLSLTATPTVTAVTYLKAALASFSSETSTAMDMFIRKLATTPVLVVLLVAVRRDQTILESLVTQPSSAAALIIRT